MSSVAARLSVAGVLAMSVACSSMPTVVRRTFVATALPQVDVELAVPAGHSSEIDRDVYAAFTTLRILGTWLAPFADSTIAIAVDRTPWWTAPAAMVPEYAVSRAVSRRYWARALDTRNLPDWFVAGLSEYCARRAVSKIVDERYLAVYRSRVEGRYFGGFVPRDLRMPMRVEDEGDPVDEFRSRPRGLDSSAREARVLLALGTLERWVGRPVFDQIIAELVRSGGQPSLDDVTSMASRVSGQDLRWFFDQTIESNHVIDYGIESLSSELRSDGRYDTQLTVRRFGDGIFTGASDGGDDRFERGRAIVVATTFADGETVRDTWDGRHDATSFRYRSAARAVSAEVDPDRLILLDINRGNNGVALESGPARSAARRWAARWMIWLEDCLLTYVTFT